MNFILSIFFKEIIVSSACLRKEQGLSDIIADKTNHLKIQNRMIDNDTNKEGKMFCGKIKLTIFKI